MDRIATAKPTLVRLGGAMGATALGFIAAAAAAAIPAMMHVIAMAAAAAHAA